MRKRRTALILTAAALAAVGAVRWSPPHGGRVHRPALPDLPAYGRAPTAEEEAGWQAEGFPVSADADVLPSAKPGPRPRGEKVRTGGPRAQVKPSAAEAVRPAPAAPSAPDVRAVDAAPPAAADEGAGTLPVRRAGQLVDGDGTRAAQMDAAPGSPVPAVAEEAAPGAARQADAGPAALSPPVLVSTGALRYPQTGYRMVVDRQGLSAQVRTEAASATVVLKVLVRADGTVGAVEVARSSGDPALDEAAASSAVTWVFRPATLDDRPIDAWAVIPVRFEP